MAEKVCRAAIYARLSREDGDKSESNSITGQKAICGGYISRNAGMELAETYVDDGYSGVSFDRPGFRAMEQAIRERKIDCVVCKDLSRFSRNYIDAGRYIEKIFPQLGIRFVAVNDGYDSALGNAQTDSYLIPFKNLINDAYCRDISIKIRTNLDAKRRRGEYVGAFAPYGYIKSPDDRNRLVPDARAAQTVRSIFSMYKDGASAGQIAVSLNESGVPSPLEYKIARGSRFETAFKSRETAEWSYAAVRRILKDEVYTGALAQGKHSSPNYKMSKQLPKREAEWIRVENTHEPIVSREDFKCVATMLGRDRRAGGCGDTGLFSGFLFCADCGQTMVRKTVALRGKKYVYYVCSASRQRECSPHSVSESELERVVLNAIRDREKTLLNLPEALGYIDGLPQRRESESEPLVRGLEEDIARCRRMNLRLLDELSDGVIDEREYEELRGGCERMIRKKGETLARVRSGIGEAESAGVTAGSAVGSAAGIAAGNSARRRVEEFRANGGTESLDRRILAALTDRILVHRGHMVEIEFRYRDEFRLK